MENRRNGRGWREQQGRNDEGQRGYEGQGQGTQGREPWQGRDDGGRFDRGD